MNPSSKEAPKFNVPQPESEQLPPSSADSQEAAGKKPERTAAAPERASSPPAGMPVAGTTAALPLPAANNSAQADDNSTTKDTKKPLLEDTDLIEKEWVNKAKRIVENTRDDPHKQSEELTGVKAEYMKQHYGKTIKLK